MTSRADRDDRATALMQLDLVLSRGNVLDGSGAPPRTLDVGIVDAEIAALAPPGSLAGRRRYDCSGLCVAPGFIDTHAHSELRVLVDPALPMKLRQGVTFEVLGQDGISVAPVAETDLDEAQREVATLLGEPRTPWTWRAVGDYLAALDACRPHLDLAYLAPHGPIRRAILGSEDRAPRKEELGRMVEAVEKALSEGAIGLSAGLSRPPSSYARTAELIELCRPVARAGAVFAVHLRSESDQVLSALDEAIEAARVSGARLHVSHLKIAGIQNFAVLEELIERCEAARGTGVRLTADQYPYTAGCTMLGEILPPWARSGGPTETLARLGTRAVRERLRAELADPRPVAWENFWKWSGPEGIVVMDVPSGRHRDLVGKSIAEAAARRGTDAFELAFDLLASEQLAVWIVSHSQSEAVLARLMTLPWVNVCSGARPAGRPHPRAYGTYPRVLSRYVRDRTLLPLEEAIRKMTSQAAQALGLRKVGLLAPGYRANAVVFDPERVRDEATFAEPIHFPLGIRHVLTGGVPMVRDEVGTGLPGSGRVQFGAGG